MIKIYRAVPKEGFEEDKIYKAQITRRTPSNVPYLVDNIWEFLRPANYPSRRFAAYASPTKELALENASSVGHNKDDYFVLEVIFNQNDVKLAHIAISDARYHADISKIMRHVIFHLGKDFSNMSLNEKARHAALFIPSVSKEELENYFKSSEHGIQLAHELRKLSTFWKEAALVPQSHNGELFFEVSGTLTYKLKKIE